MSNSDNKDMTNDELIIGICGGIGADLESVIKQLKFEFNGHFGFEFKEIKITKLYENKEVIEYFRNNAKEMKNIYEMLVKLRTLLNSELETNKLEELKLKIEIGDAICEYYKLNCIHAIYAIDQIKTNRDNLEKEVKGKKRVFIIDQLKRKDEFYLLKKIYGRSFLMIGVFEDEERRLNELQQSKKDADKAKMLIEKDKEGGSEFSQQINKLFPEAHFIVNVGKRHSYKSEISRFVKLLFSNNFITPTIQESCIYIARNLALRSADLSRQVGAVIADDDGNIIATGWNDVPKPDGGLYHAEDNIDLRDYVYGYDSNQKEIKKISEQLIEEMRKDKDENWKEIAKKIIVQIKKDNDKGKDGDSNFYKIFKKAVKLLEFGRCIHAEEAAICDAARRGVPIKGANLYSTTFPCHLCSKHIIGAGIKNVYYIEPYPKSKVEELFEETVAIYESHHHDDKVNYIHFSGVKPKAFRHLFKVDDPTKERRKNKNGEANEYGRANISEKPELIYPLRILHSCLYENLEKELLEFEYDKKKEEEKTDKDEINVKDLIVEYFENALILKKDGDADRNNCLTTLKIFFDILSNGKANE